MREITRSTAYPTWGMVARWLQQHKEFRELYTRAREYQADYYADTILEEALKAKDSDTAQAARVRIDALKWVASKLKPRMYGDRQVIEHDLSDKLLARVQEAEKRLKPVMQSQVSIPPPKPVQSLSESSNNAIDV